ncbi:MAG: mechanosensitive ion channel family protein [Verrucomicrobiales bacterium]|nr:mechanosensitive ion channel family protein [Verrucomicrobiales bacterium]
MTDFSFLLAQAEPPSAAEAPASAPDAVGGDVAGEIDVNAETIFERIDNLLDGFLKILPNLVIGTLVFILFFFASKWIASMLKRKLTGDRENLGAVFSRLSRLVVLLLGFLVAAAIIAPSVKPGDLLATLGVGGVAIGFAFKDILQNFLAGILLLVRQPFETGDQIQVGDHVGTVESIETRSTFIKTHDGRRVIIPNGDIYMSAVIVKTAFPVRRSEYDVGIGCNDSIAEARGLLLETLEGVEGVVSDPAPQVLAVALADSANILRARWWTDSAQATVMKVQDRVLEAIEAALTNAGIDLPYPTQVMLFHDQTEETDGIRSKQREGWPAGGEDPKTARITDGLREGREQSGGSAGKTRASE